MAAFEKIGEREVLNRAEELRRQRELEERMVEKQRQILVNASQRMAIEAKVKLNKALKQ